MATFGGFPSDGRRNESLVFKLFRIEKPLALKGDFAVASNDGVGASAVFVKTRLGGLSNCGEPLVCCFKNVPGELAFEFLPDLSDFGNEGVQFVDIQRTGK